MRTLDRYIIRNFLVAALLSFLVLMSLRVVIDLFINMDEFAKQGRSFGETVGDIVSYYGYQSLVYLTELGGVILVTAAAFTLARMNHTNELTAILASGVSLYRVVWPILICAMLLCGLIIVDRELVMPPVAHKLVLRRGDPPTKPFAIRLVDDEKGSIWHSPEFDPAEEVMKNPIILVRDKEGMRVADIRGQEARSATLEGRRGWALTDAVIVPDSAFGAVWRNTPRSKQVFTSISPTAIREKLPADGGSLKLLLVDPGYGDMRTEGVARLDLVSGQIELLDATFTFAVRGVHVGTIVGDSAVLQSGEERECYWELKEGRLFFPSELTTGELQLRQSKRWQSFLSVGQLTRLLRSRRVPDAQAMKLLIQSRVTDPINNLVMLLIGLPFILSRERNIRASASLCLLMVGAFYVFIYICRYMGLPPTLAAWLPVLLFGPITAVMIDAMKT